MLPKKNRLDKKTIENIFKNGLFVNSPNLTFKFIKNHNTDTKISFITPKNVSKKAVVRNKLRRRGYLILNKYRTKLPQGVSGAFIFNKNSNQLFGFKKTKNHNPIQSLEDEIKTLFSKIN